MSKFNENNPDSPFRLDKTETEPEISADYGDYLSAVEESLKREKERNGYPEETVTAKKKVKTKKSAKHKKFRINKKLFMMAAAIIVSAALLVTVISLLPKDTKKSKTKAAEPDIKVPAAITKEKLTARASAKTVNVDADIVSKNIIFIDGESNKIIASRSPDERVFPASTTKIMTLLVAVENAKSLTDTFTMTLAITDPLYIAGATVAGFASGEVIDIEDMLYGTILPSGADAAMGLAIKLCGSEQEFVRLMNEKAKELGLKNTHFENVTGLHSENHYTTVSEMAVILRAAYQNEICREILSTYQYTTKPTEKHPNGILLSSTLFSYMYGTEPEGADIAGGKTGYTSEAGYCMATFGYNSSNKPVFCVAFNGTTRWPAVYDQIKLYSKYSNINP